VLKTEDGRSVTIPVIDNAALAWMETRGQFVYQGGDSGGYRYETTAVNFFGFDAWEGQPPAQETTTRAGYIMDVRDAAEYDFMVGWDIWGDTWNGGEYPDAWELRRRFYPDRIPRFNYTMQSGGGN
jgi:hypothetical protein